MGKPAVQPSTESPDDLRGAGSHAGPVEERRQRHALPDGIADEAPADLVGHALQGDRLLDAVDGEQLVVGDLDRSLDETR